jgi:hypothetical protein
MSNPGPPGEDERPLAGPGTGMGLPESGTQHATSPDFDPLDRATTPQIPPPTDTDVFGATPVEPVAPTPPSGGSLSSSDPLLDTGGISPSDTLSTTSAYGSETGSPSGAGGVLEKVKAFADQRPEAFLAAALVAGWVVGKLLGSSDDDDEDQG